jgi:hypothetical protein
MRILPCVLAVLAIAGCRQRMVSDQPTVATETPDEGSTEETPSALDSDGSAPPAIRLDEQRCETHADCRVIQPGDWNPRVECCYEYSCDLDYVSVNQDTWALVRQWQRANPFDCTEHLREEGPCSARAQPCGLVQDSPAAECSNGLCRVAIAPPWPAIDPEMQRCTEALSCVAYPSNGGSFDARCCGLACADTWAAVNRQTAGELDRWRNYHATPCEVLMEAQTCPRLEDCNSTAPSTTCLGGRCTIVSRP